MRNPNYRAATAAAVIFDIVNGYLNDAVGHRVFRLGGYGAEQNYRLMAARPATVMSLVVRVFKREVRAFGGCLGMHRR